MTDQGADPKSLNGHLPDRDWQWVSENLPIACVDVLPVQRDSDGAIRRIGLIRRESPMGEKWCHLGGRLVYGESMLDGANRHTIESVDGGALARFEPQPFFVNQYFPEHREGMGFDPRKHAVAACFLAEFPADTDLLPVGSEAIGFSWFRVDELPDAQELWPGSALMIEQVDLEPRWKDELTAYEALSARCISHNELMWQTPVLAMTAIAFLLTIALGGEDDWKRALAAGLSTTIAAISAQLMAKHSTSQIADSVALSAIEKRRNMVPVHVRAHVPASFSLRNPIPWLSKWRSRMLWFYSLILITVVSFVIFVLALFHV